MSPSCRGGGRYPSGTVPIFSNIFELPDTDPQLEEELETIRDFQPVFDNSLELELEQETQRPRANKALLRSYVEHSGAGQHFINSKHLDKALPILDQLKQGPNVTVDASGERQSVLCCCSICRELNVKSRTFSA